MSNKTSLQAGADKPLLSCLKWAFITPVFGLALGAWLGCKWTGIRFWTFADALAPGLLLAQAVGRFGNYFNQELFGLGNVDIR